MIGEQDVPCTLKNYDKMVTSPQFYEQQNSGIAVFQSVESFIKVYNLFLPSYRYPKFVQIFVLFRQEKVEQLTTFNDLARNSHVYYFLVNEIGFIRPFFGFYWPLFSFRLASVARTTYWDQQIRHKVNQMEKRHFQNRKV